MTLTELRYLVTLAHEKHFGRAAIACHISQPTLSVAINKLESELGVLIFERDPAQIRLTEMGEEITKQAQRTLNEAAQIKAIAEGGKSQLTTPLKIGAIYTIGPYLFPNLIPTLKKMTPTMPLIIQEDYTENLRVKLQLGELDAIFISLPFSEKGVVVKGLYDESFVLLMRKEHALSKKASIKFSDLSAEDILLLGKGHCFREQIIEMCPECFYNKDLQNSIEGTSIETLRHMVASGLGVTILPSSATQIKYYQSSLLARSFSGKVPERRVALAFRASFTRPKAMTALIAALHATKLVGVCLLPDLI